MKKVYILVISLIILATSLSFLYILGKKGRILEKNGENVICNFQSDEHVLSVAIKNENIQLCPCLKNKDKIAMCMENVKDISIYNQAIKYLNIEYCSGIKSEYIKENCLNIINSGLKYIEKHEE